MPRRASRGLVACVLVSATSFALGDQVAAEALGSPAHGGAAITATAIEPEPQPSGAAESLSDDRGDDSTSRIRPVAITLLVLLGAGWFMLSRSRDGRPA